MIQAEMAVDPDNPADTEGFGTLRDQGWEAGDELPAGAHPRSLRQKRHDALRKALRRLLDSGALGTRDKVVPHLGVTISVDALHGEAERMLKPHERRAKQVETGGRCQAAGCRCGPGSRLHPHHPDPWHKSGTTSYADTVMLCDANHHDIHSGGKTILLKDGRRRRPEGWADGPAR